MNYRTKSQEVNAAQWFKNGDHPLDYAGGRIGHNAEGDLENFSALHCKENDWEGSVVRRFRHPEIDGDLECLMCRNKMHIHGWIDKGNNGFIVCPGDWIVTPESGEHVPVKPKDFERYYEPNR